MCISRSLATLLIFLWLQELACRNGCLCDAFFLPAAPAPTTSLISLGVAKGKGTTTAPHCCSSTKASICNRQSNHVRFSKSPLSNEEETESHATSSRSSNSSNSNSNNSSSRHSPLNNNNNSLVETIGLICQPVVWWSLYAVFTTGAGLPAGPFGLLGAIEGVSYLVVVGLAGSAMLLSMSRTRAQKVSLVTLGTGLLVLLKLVGDQGCIPNAKPLFDYSNYLPVCNPDNNIIGSTAGFFGGLFTFLLTSRTVPVRTAGYLLVANIVYLARRAQLRQQSMKTMLGYRLAKEPGVSWPRYCSFLVAWQCVVVIFPLLEPVLKLFFDCCCLYYSYPNAHGFGFIVEPLNCQHLPLNKRAKQQLLRLDWHRFNVNVGEIGRNGFRHPPAVQMNRPHVDAPRYGIKHWPWKRRHTITALGRTK